MGWNGGGFGHMTFETADGVAAWKAATVKHDQWTDWVDWFETPLDKAFTVASELKTLSKFHKPEKAAYLAVEEQGTTVNFLFESGEDTFRDLSGTIAAVLRASAPHGARGMFHFLGTAGAEYDFTYKLEIANGHSTLESLHEVEIATVYEGEAYQQFMTKVMTALGVIAEGEELVHAGSMPSEEPTPKPAKATAPRAAAKAVAEKAAKAAKPPAKSAVKKAAPAKKAGAKPGAKKPAAKKPR